MPLKQQDNSGVLYINTRKMTVKHPDFTGNLLLDGKEYWLSAWQKVSKSGQNFITLSARDKTHPPPKPGRPLKLENKQAVDDDDLNDPIIPF